MALKEKALRRLGEKLTAANIPFAAGGEWLHCQLGQSAVYHIPSFVSTLWYPLLMPPVPTKC